MGSGDRGKIAVRNASIHNLKNVNVDVPKGRFVVVTGVSGSGKSSFAFDLLFEEGRRRYLQAMGYQPRVEEEDVFDEITGLPPTIAVEQRVLRLTNPRSVVGTRTKIFNLLRTLYSLSGRYQCPRCGGPAARDAACPKCGDLVPGMAPSAFSFNSPDGMCLKCFGRGYEVRLEEERVVGEPALPVMKALSPPVRALVRHPLQGLAEARGFSLATPFSELSAADRHAVLHGCDASGFPGVMAVIDRWLRRSHRNRYERNRKVFIERRCCGRSVCRSCRGDRVCPEARCVTVGGKPIGQLGQMDVGDLLGFLTPLEQGRQLPLEGRRILKAVLAHLALLCDVGLGHLSLFREVPSLSGGEQTRLFFVAHLDCGLDSVAYILDEPTVGLHELEKAALLDRLKRLTANGHTVIVVEHDQGIIGAADHVIDFGPGGGKDGGEVVFEGSYQALLRSGKSITGEYLSGRRAVPVKAAGDCRPVSPQTPCLTLRHVTTHNLKDLTVGIPLGVMVGVAGVSGSGKSSLVADTLVPMLASQLAGHELDEGGDEEFGAAAARATALQGWRHLKRYAVVSQAPIGRMRRSIPATYIGIWDRVRGVFARQTEARARGYTPGHFSFNSEKGACPDCLGEGVKHVAIGFGTVFRLPCQECRGTGYKGEVLEVRYRGRTIHEVLEAGVAEARELFAPFKPITRVLAVMERVGLGYITLGQPAPTLSGGEAQRIKLAKELGRARKPGTLYIMDEPTIGLSYADSARLMRLLDELVEQGNSVIVIEHDPAFLSFCDWIIELGPGGGEEGGRIIAQGPPGELARDRASRVGPFLKVAAEPARPGGGTGHLWGPVR